MIRAFINKHFQQQLVLGFILFFLGICLCPATALSAVLEGIHISSSPLAVKLDMSQKVPAKVIQIEGKEVLVALRNISPGKNFSIRGKAPEHIRDIRFQTLDDDVLAIVISGKSEFLVSGHSFDDSGSQFTIHLKTPVRPPRKKAVKSDHSPETTATDTVTEIRRDVPARKESPERSVEPLLSIEDDHAVQQDILAAQIPRTPAGNPKQTPSDAANTNASVLAKDVKKMAPPVYKPSLQPQGEFQGSLEDMCVVVSKTSCKDSAIVEALSLLNSRGYEKAAEILDKYLLNENAPCNGSARFLKGLGHYRGQKILDDNTKLAILNLFQDAVLSNPESSLTPFGFAAIGMLHLDLQNPYAALGYLNLVKEKYPDYPGMPEVTYHMARIYEKQGFTDKAMRYYQEVFQAPERNSSMDEAGFGYARLLFDNQQFFNSLSIFNYLAQKRPKMAYESPRFLTCMGNANFELGYTKTARENYIRGINIFPELAEKDILLSKIGDTYAMENQREKAIKFYDLVRENFPDSSGYITASMGMARYVDTDEERVKIYEMIKERFPKNTYARIAMMRLAQMYQKNQEYDKCIREIENLLSTHPKGLRYEAVKLMQEAYEALFKSKLKEGNYTDVLKRYEKEQVKIDKMDSKSISQSVGLAYLEAKLYEPAFNHLINAYKQYKRRQRSAQLLFGLGKAMNETNRNEDALKLFEGFVRQFPTHQDRVKAFVRMGKIYTEKGKFALATARLKQAFSHSKNEIEKADILFLQALVCEKENQLAKAAQLRNQGIRHIAAAPGTHYDLLVQAYRDLGALEIKACAYVDAAEAYAKALDFSREEDGKANIGFLLGDAYQKGNIVTKAREAFEQVAQNYDSVWARLAKQRLETLALAQGLTNS